MSNSIFEEATKQKLRFQTIKGDLTTEQLWDLPLSTTRTGFIDLDTVAKSVNTALRAQNEDSFVQKRANPVKAELSLKLEVVKAVISRKQADEIAARYRAVNNARKTQLLEALNNQQQKKLLDMDEAAIRAELASLED